MAHLTTIGRRRFLGLSAGAAAATLLPRAAHADVTLKSIKESGKLRIGVEAAYVPFTFRKDGVIVGYDIDLADIFTKSLGVKPEVIDTAWAGVIPSLYAKKFDMIMSAMTYTAERVQRVAFSIPYAEASQALLIRAADTGAIKGLDDLSGKVVGIKLGSPGEVLVKRHDEGIKQRKGGKGITEVKVFNDHPAAYLSLGQGKVDVGALCDLLESSGNDVMIMAELDPSPKMPLPPLEAARINKAMFQNLGYSFRT